MNAGSIEDNVVYGQIPFWLGDTVVLPMAFPKIHEQARAHRPEFILLQMHLANVVIGKPGIIIKLISSPISSSVSSLIRISKKNCARKKATLLLQRGSDSIYIHKGLGGLMNAVIR